MNEKQIEIYNAEHNKAFREIMVCILLSYNKSCKSSEKEYWLKESKTFNLDYTKFDEVFNENYPF